MCLYAVATLCRYFGIFQPRRYVLPSFADDMVDMDHAHDAALQALFASLSFPQREGLYNRRFYNPAPNQEAAHYALMQATQRGNMMTSNALLLSRVFLRHAKEAKLAEQLSDKKVLRILDVGCGNALNLMGILTYFGNEVRIEYTGVDVSSERIADCLSTYHAWIGPQMQFICEDANVFFDQGKKFDLILVQHPNFESPMVRDTMLQVFLKADKALTSGGMIYTTIYYPSEYAYFIAVVLPQLTAKGLTGNLHDNEETFKTKLSGGAKAEVYAPERYTWVSHPYHGYQLQYEHAQIQKRYSK